MSDDNQKNRLWDLVVLAAAVTILGIGYTVGQGHSNGLIAFLKEVNSQQKNDIDTLTAQIAKLEREITIKPNELVALAQISSENISPITAEIEKTDVNGERLDALEPNYYEITIQRENSARLYDGEIVISVAGIKFEKSPLRDTVYGSIGGLGLENMPLKGESPGFATVFNNFEVRVLSTSTFSATFGISRLNNS